MDMGGWDVIYASNVAALNSVLASSTEKLIPSFSFSDETLKLTFSGTFGPWAIQPGGSANRINLQVPIAKGSLSFPAFAKPLSLDGVKPVLNLALALVEGSSAGVENLKLDVTTSSTSPSNRDGDVYVANPDESGLLAKRDPTGQAASLLRDWLGEVFVANKAKISFVFATVFTDPRGASWLKPKATAVTYFESTDRAIQAIGIKTLTQAPWGPEGLSTAVDPSLLATGQNVFYALSKAAFVKNLLLPSAARALGAGAGDLRFNGPSTPADEDQASIVNATDIHLPSVDHDGTHYHPVLTSFSVSIDGGQIVTLGSGKFDITGLHDAHVTFDNLRVVNEIVYDASQQKLGFRLVEKTRPSTKKHIPWYEKWLSWIDPLIGLIEDAVLDVVVATIESSVEHALEGTGDLSPIGIQLDTAVWTGLAQLGVDQAELSEALVLRGRGKQSGASDAAWKGDVMHRNYSKDFNAGKVGDNGGDNGGDIDLLGWDTVFALGLDALNASIVAQKTTPAGFDGTDSQGGARVSGTWGAWSVEGGEGDGILMKCPVATGTLTVPGSDPMPLAGGWVEVMITLVTREGSEELTDPTARPGTGKTHVFVANQTTDPFQEPRVQDVRFDGVKGYAVYAAQDAFQAYFSANIAAFDAVFAAVRLEEEAITADKQWLKPVFSQYALATSGSASAASATEPATAFGILSLTSKASGKLPQQNFDKRMFDVFADTKTPTNSVFAVSAPLAMQEIVMVSAQHCVMGATIDDFKIVNNGITVTNKKTLNWGDFKFKKGSSDTVTPVIKPGDFQLTLDGADFHLSISQAAFTTPDGTADVKLTADQFFNMGAVKLSDGKYYFAPDPGLGTNSIRADVTANKGFEITSILLSIEVGIIFGFIGSALGEALGDAVSSGASSATQGTVDASEEAVENAINDLSEEEIEVAEQSGLNDAEDSISSGGENSGGRSGIFSNKWKVWGGVLGGMFGIPVGVLPQIMTAIYNNEIHQGNVPTVDKFATNFTGAVQWPQVESWQVTGGTFRSAFLLAGNAAP